MNKLSLVLLLGSVRKGEYETMLAYGYQLGVILDTNRHATLPARGDFAFVAHHDFAQPLFALDGVLAQLRDQFTVIAVMNLREFYVRAQAYVAQALGLPGLPAAAVDFVLNKSLMRRSFVHAVGPLSTPRFAEVTDVSAALQFARATSFPVILKPANLYGSIFVRMVHDETQLQTEFARIQQQVREHSEAFSVACTTGNLIQLEAYVTGSVHSIDCIVDGEQNVYVTPVVDVLTGHDVGQNHFGHVVRQSRTALTVATQSEMNGMAQQAVRTLQIRNAVAHVEFIASSQGPKLLEIAARPGGHRNRVLEETYGIALNYQYLRMLLGHIPELAIQTVKPFAIVTPYPDQEIIFRGVRDVDAVTKLRSYAHQQLKVAPGDKIGPARGGYMSPWVVELRHDNPAVVENDVSWLASKRDFFAEESLCVF